MAPGHWTFGIRVGRRPEGRRVRDLEAECTYGRRAKVTAVTAPVGGGFAVETAQPRPRPRHGLTVDAAPVTAVTAVTAITGVTGVTGA